MQSYNPNASNGTFKIDTMPDMFSNHGATPSSINEGKFFQNTVTAKSPASLNQFAFMNQLQQIENQNLLSFNSDFREGSITQPNYGGGLPRPYSKQGGEGGAGAR